MIDHYEADVQTAQDYYPFGMIMPGRIFTALTVPGGSVSGTTQVNGYTVPVDLALTSRTGNEPTQYVATHSIDLDEGFESGVNDDVMAYLTDTSYAGSGNGGSGSDGVAGAGKYRYGFNGKENDNEVKGMGDQIDYGSRIYDPRVGKFLSVDPLTRSFPQLTPYQFSSNAPIKFIDLDGAEHFDLNIKPTGVTALKNATIPGGITTKRALKAGEYDLVGVNNEQGKDYWIARYTYTSGNSKGMYRDDYIVGTDGVFNFIKNAEQYLWKANAVEVAQTLGGDQNADIDLSGAFGRSWVKMITNPMNWIAAGSIYAASLPGQSSIAAGEGIPFEAPGNSAAGGSRSINPTRGETNCAGCAVAGDATLKGRPASAIDHGVIWSDKLEKDFGGNFERGHTSGSIIKTMQGLGDGATGIVLGDRGPGAIGHYFNVINKNGVIQFLDFQKSGSAVMSATETSTGAGASTGYKNLWLLKTTGK